MNALNLALTAALLAAPAVAQRQEPSQEDLRARYEEKLTHEFIKAGGWMLDYDEARASAAREKKLLFTYFTRTYSP